VGMVEPHDNRQVCLDDMLHTLPNAFTSLTDVETIQIGLCALIPCVSKLLKTRFV